MCWRIKNAFVSHFFSKRTESVGGEPRSVSRARQQDAKVGADGGEARSAEGVEQRRLHKETTRRKQGPPRSVQNGTEEVSPAPEDARGGTRCGQPRPTSLLGRIRPAVLGLFSTWSGASPSSETRTGSCATPCSASSSGAASSSRHTRPPPPPPPPPAGGGQARPCAACAHATRDRGTTAPPPHPSHPPHS